MNNKNNMNIKIYNFTTLSSTNDKLKDLITDTEIKEYTVINTFNQTNGKGQLGNFWESEINKNLSFSIFSKPEYISASNQFIISKAVSLGIINVLSKFSNDFSIKWPNDIYYKDSKIAGILIENSIMGNKINNCIIGVGININQNNFISSAPNPISLSQITNKTYNLNTMLNSFIKSIVTFLEDIKGNNENVINNIYFDSLYRKNGYYKYEDKNGIFEAAIHNITNYGHIQLITKDKDIKTYAFKEVKFIT